MAAAKLVYVESTGFLSSAEPRALAAVELGNPMQSVKHYVYVASQPRRSFLDSVSRQLLNFCVFGSQNSCVLCAPSSWTRSLCAPSRDAGIRRNRTREGGDLRPRPQRLLLRTNHRTGSGNPLVDIGHRHENEMHHSPPREAGAGSRAECFAVLGRHRAQREGWWLPGKVRVSELTGKLIG